MIKFSPPYSSEARDLEQKATEILSKDRALDGNCPSEIDLKSHHDQNRRRNNRQKILNSNEETVTSLSVSREYRFPPEKELIKKQQQEKLRGALKDVLTHFEGDYVVKAIIIQVLHPKFEKQYSDTLGLAELAGVSVNQINAAKKRLQRHVREHFDGILNH